MGICVAILTKVNQKKITNTKALAVIHIKKRGGPKAFQSPFYKRCARTTIRDESKFLYNWNFVQFFSTRESHIFNEHAILKSN